MGMPMAVHPVGDVMDFSMGSGKKILASDCEDEDDDDDDDEYGGDGGSSGNCLDVKPSAWTLSNVSSTINMCIIFFYIRFQTVQSIFSLFKTNRFYTISIHDKRF